MKNHSRNYINIESQNKFLEESSYNFISVKKQAYTIFYIFILILISFSVLLYISQVLNINNYSAKIINLENKLKNIQAKNERLELKLANKTSLAEIEKIAKNELNMVEAQKKETLVYQNIEKEKRFKADIPKEKFFLVQIYDKIIREVITVQAESLE